MTKEQLLAEAKALDPKDQEDLAEEIWLGLHRATRPEVDAAWLEEARRRDAAFRAGQVTASPLDEVVARLMAKGRP